MNKMSPTINNDETNTEMSSYGTNSAEFPTHALQVYWRLIQFVFLMITLLLVILWLTEHHDVGWALFLIGVIALWTLYMMVQICCILRSLHNLAVPTQPRDGLLIRDDDYCDDSDEIRDDDGNEDELLRFDFDETPTQIRDCHQARVHNLAPKNGPYTVVYAALYFGKAMRSEAKMTLDFKEKINGWEITGRTDFKTTAIIEDGFVNARGEMYWVTKDCLYRGVLDIATSTMFDGEFLSSTGNRGRVVRLESDRASAGIEMSRIGGTKFKTQSLSLGGLP
jgi:hypothetical protein